MQQKYFLIINSGSTSLKYKLFSAKNLREIFAGQIKNIGSSKGIASNHYEALRLMVADLEKKNINLRNISALGHRVVHGGEKFYRSMIINDKIFHQLKKYEYLAPLHNPANLLGIKAARTVLKGIPNIAVFDTAFHRTISKPVFIYALPLKYYTKHGIRRYGFHGISHQYVVEEAARRLKKPLSRLKLISCHLGGGSSVAAIDRGRVVDTSMGFTPLEGLIMMTRPGDLDPSIPLFMQRKLGLTANKVDDIFNQQSGIYGLTGCSDMLTFLKKVKQRRKKEQLAFESFIHRLKKYIGAYYAILGGVDAIIFTGTVGAGLSITRQAAVKGLPFLQHVKILAISTNEELMIAREVKKLIKK